MLTSPTLPLEVRLGPSLSLVQAKSPALALQPMVAPPVLALPLEVSSTYRGEFSSNTIPALVFVCLGSLVAIVTLPLSQGSQWARIPIQKLIDDATVLVPSWSEPDVHVDTEPVQEPAEEITAESPPQAASPFKLLVGVNCSEYFPGDQISASSAAFEEHVWRKLPAELQAQAAERLEVCGPFEPVNDEVIVSQGCVENGCGINDVRFFLTADNKAAIEILSDGQCTPSSEPGFRHQTLLCAQR
ncbi:MAG: hypothetical protein ACKO5X_07240 [Limnohabitans sp.]